MQSVELRRRVQVRLDNVQSLRNKGVMVDDALVIHLFLLGWEHINLAVNHT